MRDNSGFGGATSDVCQIVEIVEVVAELRRTFDLDSVGILCRSASGWRANTSAGAPLCDDPGAAHFSAELTHNVLLVMTGPGLTHSDAELGRVFCAEMLLARRRAQHDDSAVHLRVRVNPREGRLRIGEHPGCAASQPADRRRRHALGATTQQDCSKRHESTGSTTVSRRGQY